MKSKKPIWFDPAGDASDYLKTVLKTGSGAADSTSTDDLVIIDEKLKREAESEGKMPAPAAIMDKSDVAGAVGAVESVDAARTRAPILESTSNRSTPRVLHITKDISILEDGSASRQRIVEQRGNFQEIHIAVLAYDDGSAQEPIVRLFENVWLYRTYASSWWKMWIDAYRLIESQMVFSGGFRADIVLADDPFETGLIGLRVSQKYNRPFQLHIYEDFFDRAYIESLTHPTLYEWGVGYVLNRVKSIRTKTAFQRQAIIERRAECETFTELLPNYYNLEAWRDFVPSFDIHERYPQFKFIMVCVSSMKAQSHAGDCIAGVAKLLRRYPSIGLVMVGNGPLRSVLEKQAIALGLQNQIEFEPMPAEVLSHIKTANAFVHLSEDGMEDEYILQAAVSKVPMVVTGNGLAGTLFTDTESAYLCNPDDAVCVSNGVNRYLNDNHERTSFGLAAHEAVFSRVEQDYASYLVAYADTIVRGIVENSQNNG